MRKLETEERGEVIEKIGKEFIVHAALKSNWIAARILINAGVNLSAYVLGGLMISATLGLGAALIYAALILALFAWNASSA